MHRANTVADFFLCRSRDFGDYLTNLKLQKLLYYAQGWNLALRDEPLFSDPIEAWIHGPVVPIVYGRFKAFRWNPIIEDVARPRIKVGSFLDEVLEKYGRFTAHDLERMTHAETPWIHARSNIASEAACRQKISLGEMRAFFKSKLE